MNTDQLNLKSDKLFPLPFQLAGIAFLFCGMVCLVFAPIAAPILIVGALLILTARRGILFDRAERSYRVYNEFLFFKKGKTEYYQEVRSLYIYAASYRQQVNTMVTTGITSKTREYDAYLKLDDDGPLFLLSHKKLEVVRKKLENLADFLEIELQEAK
jgi:hypothetical protein